MSKYLIDSNTLTNITDSIRAKTGKTDLIKIENISDEITNIQGSSSSIDLSDATATPLSIVEGMTAYTGEGKITGIIKCDYTQNIPMIKNSSSVGENAVTTVNNSITCEIGDFLIGTILSRTGVPTIQSSGWTILSQESRYSNGVTQYQTICYKIATSTVETFNVYQSSGGRLLSQILVLDKQITSEDIEIHPYTDFGEYWPAQNKYYLKNLKKGDIIVIDTISTSSSTNILPVTIENVTEEVQYEAIYNHSVSYLSQARLQSFIISKDCSGLYLHDMAGSSYNSNTIVKIIRTINNEIIQRIPDASEIRSGSNFLGVEGTYTGSGFGITKGSFSVSDMNTLKMLITTVPELNLTSTTSMYNFFYKCTNINTIPNLATNSVYNMAYLFCECWNLQTIPNLSTTALNSCQGMFYNCQNLTSVPNLYLGKVSNMAFMFGYCTNLTEVPNFNTVNCNNLSSVFYGCSNLKTVPNWNTSKVNMLQGTFYYCTNLTEIPNWDTSNVTQMHTTFNGCRNLSNIPQWNTDKLTAMSFTFTGAGINTIPNWNYNATTNMAYAFAMCNNLIDINDLLFPAVTVIYNMFSSCNNLKDIYNINMPLATNAYGLFGTCINLINIGGIELPKVWNATYMFWNCRNLISVEQLNMPLLNSAISMFAYCNNLSDESIQNIINMFLNAKFVTGTYYKNLSNSNSYSPFRYTNITNDRYENRWTELTAAGWKY